MLDTSNISTKLMLVGCLSLYSLMSLLSRIARIAAQSATRSPFSKSRILVSKCLLLRARARQ